MKDYNNATWYYYSWLKRKNAPIDHAHHVISLYESVLNSMSKYLIESVAKFDVFLIIVSVILSTQVYIYT